MSTRPMEALDRNIGLALLRTRKAGKQYWTMRLADLDRAIDEALGWSLVQRRRYPGTKKQVKANIRAAQHQLGSLRAERTNVLLNIRQLNAVSA